MENGFYTVLEQVILAQNPEMYVYARRVHMNMVPKLETACVRVYKDSAYFPKAPAGYKFKADNSSAYVRMEVVQHDLIANTVLLSDGKVYPLSQTQQEESSWIHELEEIPAKSLQEDIY